MKHNENHPDYEIKRPKLFNVQSTFTPPNYPANAIEWMVEFNATKKVTSYDPTNKTNYSG